MRARGFSVIPLGLASAPDPPGGRNPHLFDYIRVLFPRYSPPFLYPSGDLPWYRRIIGRRRYAGFVAFVAILGGLFLFLPPYRFMGRLDEVSLERMEKRKSYYFLGLRVGRDFQPLLVESAEESDADDWRVIDDHGTLRQRPFTTYRLGSVEMDYATLTAAVELGWADASAKETYLFHLRRGDFDLASKFCQSVSRPPTSTDE